jgi:predicted nucleotidyltransferase
MTDAPIRQPPYEYRPEILAYLEQFKADLAAMQTQQIVGQYITFGESKIIDNARYYELKTAIAQHFEVNAPEVIVVGSAKMGFSIAPNKRYRPFNNESDIDLAIISPQIFDEIWEGIYRYFLEHGRWERSREFKDYLFKGWLRPDVMPRDFPRGRQWWDFFAQLTQTRQFGPYPIAGGLYKSWSFFERYQFSTVDKCKVEARLSIVGEREENPANNENVSAE